MPWTRPTLRGVGPVAAPSNAPGKGGCLHSWKEIAGYLNHGVRTVQRWEETEGLPVHRHAHEKRDSVYAYPDELDGWWSQHQGSLQATKKLRVTPPPDSVASRSVRLPKWAIAAATLLIFVLVAVGIWRSWAARTLPVLPFVSRNWVLIADIENQTGDPVFDRSLLTAFTASLEQSTYANVLPRSRINASLQRMGKRNDTRIDEQLGREICLRENVQGLIASGITKVGREYALSARLINPRSGLAVRSHLEHARNQDAIITALSHLTASIRKDLGESLASIRQNDHPLPLVTTSSLDALRLFSEGGDLWRKGDYHEAVKAFEAALKDDPDFAMAHAALGSAYISHIFNEKEKGKEHYQQALRRAERITDRERLYLQASMEHRLGHVPEAIQGYRLFLSNYPDDISARYDLANLLLQDGRFEEALPEYDAALRLDVRDARCWVNKAVCFREQNLIAEALECYSKAFELQPSWMTLGNLNHEYGFALVGSGDIMKAREIFGRAVARPEMKSRGLRSLALLDMFQGKYRDAEAPLRQATMLDHDAKEALTEAHDHMFLAILLEGRGDRSGQLRELNQVGETMAAHPPAPLWLNARLGALYARAGMVAKAERFLRTVTAQVDRESNDQVSDLHLLEGEVALAGGDFPTAIERLQMVSQSAGVPLAMRSMARAYQNSGSTAQAIATYERFVALKTRTYGWEPQQSWLEAHADLAELYLRSGDRDKAAAVLDELAGLWKDADADSPLMRRIRSIERELSPRGYVDKAGKYVRTGQLNSTLRTQIRQADFGTPTRVDGRGAIGQRLRFLFHACLL
ncbi:MAG TPA: tetratricopeptide repeat protein [Bryobacteraceae bacterium]|nr:tetratricopeptide repeat protein [Bryobacteraceae bacterium]